VSRQHRPRSEIGAASGKSQAPSARGVLYVVATPIGNLGDLSARAREVMLACDLVAAEDTRHSDQLLQSAGIAKRTLSAHEHNETQRAAEILAALDAGKTVALISDAGTPLISDPGFRIVQSAARAGHEVRAVPGPCAAIAALSIAGLPTDRFVFEGFLPAKAAAREARLKELAGDTRTLVFYEAPHRLQETLAQMSEWLGPQRGAAVAREITKAFETVYRGELATLAERAALDADMQRGEIVIVVEGAAANASVDEQDLERVLKELLAVLPVSQAASIAARLTGINRNRAYRAALALAKPRT
jgi:16S rRNA (cytidine1402-2'-O)-methyltransferase